MTSELQNNSRAVVIAEVARLFADVSGVRASSVGACLKMLPAPAWADEDHHWAARFLAHGTPTLPRRVGCYTAPFTGALELFDDLAAGGAKGFYVHRTPLHIGFEVLFSTERSACNAAGRNHRARTGLQAQHMALAGAASDGTRKLEVMSSHEIIFSRRLRRPTSGR